MVEARLDLEPEVQEIFSHIDENRNFLLSGGAGSGKTYSLVQVIRQALLENPTAKIACMTYTNAAVKEIEERVNHKNLIVSTIHDFLWDHIKHFKQELKAILIELLNEEDVTKISINEPNPIPSDYYDGLEKGIQYKEFLRLKEGIISHDELLIVANLLFSRYKKLSDILKDKYKFIFIDEYQDTSKSVVDIFLTHFKQSAKHNVIGFFGDAMQAIYDDGIGNLDEYKGDATDLVAEVKKEQNRRNPQKVIDLANKLRTDGLIQVHSNDGKAPNMLDGEVKQGEILFIHSTVAGVDEVKLFLEQHHGWNFLDSKETKQLNLTHNLIADKAEFRTLMDIYDKDPIIGLKGDILEKIKDNKEKGRPEILIEESDTFDAVVDKFQLKNRQRNLKKDVILSDPLMSELYNRLKDKPFSEVRKIYINKDALVDDKKQDENDDNKKGSKRDKLIRHLFKIQTNIHFYTSKQYNEFLRATDYRHKIVSIADKRQLKENIESLVDVGDKTIETIINEANEKGICLIDDNLEKFKTEKEYLYLRVKDVKFREFQKLYEYLEGRTPFTTQHKTKGDEFNNVLVIMDNGGWNSKYNFEKLFTLEGSQNVLSNSQKIFYVCCTRAKEKLAVFYFDPKPVVIDKAKEWFGEENVVSI
ncbi:ATP-dependent helicase [Elizabethkingia anophelis]|uniref:UvrD-helicase domain-containing protein n=1 Tax=Elizabethkingia anophelis TaxID=1117645 RepID=UPI0013679FAF|nr:UvrD-helicase domain-containing protein [Elizabethkingia anophelis]MCT4171499.1 ATP-dependent helicase [Elizabethkingia anophelis]MCT4175490.1 ATP-dependent helicase [Elizabethkingia anophelis]MYZ59550.1 ATP-dependent helicase [Elizabethkingia anophelis]